MGNYKENKLDINKVFEQILKGNKIYFFVYMFFVKYYLFMCILVMFLMISK